MPTIKINDNIRLNFISMTKLKTTSNCAYLHRPLNSDGATYNALLPLVLRSSTKSLPSRDEISKHLQELYDADCASYSTNRGEDQLLVFYARTINDKYAPNGEKLVSSVLELLLKIMFEPNIKDNAFTKKDFDQQKIILADRINSLVNDKRSYASSRCGEETARNTNFAISPLGDKKSLENITPQSLYEYYKNIITSSVIDIYICGDADIEKSAEVVKKYTDNIHFTKASVPLTEILTRNVTNPHSVTEEMDVTQGKLSLGFLTYTKPTDNDYIHLVVFNSIFGGGVHSKLFNNVREKLSLAYYASSAIEPYKGFIKVNSGIEFENYQKAYDEILIQLKEIQNGNITEHEINSAIISIVSSTMTVFDDPMLMVERNLAHRIIGDDISLEEYIQKVQQVTAEDVVRVSQKIKLDTVYFLKGKEH